MPERIALRELGSERQLRSQNREIMREGRKEGDFHQRCICMSRVEKAVGRSVTLWNSKCAGLVVGRIAR